MLHGISVEFTCTNFNNLEYKVCQNNPHQPYPVRAQVLAHTESIHHHEEKYNNLYLKDQVWAVKKHWEKRMPSIKMSLCCKSMLSQGLWEWHNREDQLPRCINAFIGFAAVMSCELFKLLDKVDEDATHFDLLVGLSLMWFSI